MLKLKEHPDNRGLTAETLYPYYFRALICFAASGTLLNSIDWSSNWTSDKLVVAGMAIFLLIYIVIAVRLVKTAKPEKAESVKNLLAFTDAGLIGGAVALTNFNPLPSLLFVIMVQFNALNQGGGRRWFEHNTALILGIAAGYMAYRPDVVVTADLSISAASLIGVFTYFCAYAFYTHKQIKNLRIENSRLGHEQRISKMRTYKLSRYLPQRLWRAITTGKEQELATDRKLLTVFFSDIKDFSQLTEELEAETLTELLNSYLTEMSKIAAQFGGTIDKFIGDALMVVFGDDDSKGPKSDALRCIAMSIAMRRRAAEMQKEWFDKGISRPLQIRIGINTGYCTVGVFGTANHQTYTVLGTHVNLASRLESAAEPGEILVSHETWSLVKNSVLCRDKGHVTVKGFSAPVKVYQVIDMRKNLGRDQSYIEDHAPGFSMHLDLDKVRNYDKDKVLKALQVAAAKLREKVII
ncbi:adenylate/guanylate cyclase domain-containing protein [Biformimicrobium ophioploci]|uniref:Protein CyaB n=1 Tax=Biformimicrobium ophioploci TaxID=3036711 RepID=A0ABQ6LY29_9GAMM|nr:adenylate/guanylate cyclase domain-containing protein [Microbulbifer sp. NKW57]GMG86976.1 protein CyaB [Microbulbifer sp. NKW57]